MSGAKRETGLAFIGGFQIHSSYAKDRRSLVFETFTNIDFFINLRAFLSLEKKPCVSCVHARPRPSTTYS